MKKRAVPPGLPQPIQYPPVPPGTIPTKASAQNPYICTRATTQNPMNIRELPVHEHSWGVEYWLHNDPKYCMKVLEFRSKTQGSRHYHTTKEETMLVVKGKFRISGVQGFFYEYGVGDFVTFDPGTPHQIECLKAGWLVEASTQHDDNDVTRVSSTMTRLGR